jgi:hypothetical protein
MGYIERYKEEQEKLKKLQNLQNQKIPAICSMCGNIGAELYVATSNGKWDRYKEVYKTERRRFMCRKCVTIYDPSLSLIMENGSRNELRKLPLYDESGNMLPSVSRRQLDALPHFFPLTYLGEIGLTATYTRHITVSNCIVLTLIPDETDKYYINYFLNTYGFIYTCVFPNYPLKTVRLPHRIRFVRYFDKRDKPRVIIDYDVK